MARRRFEIAFAFVMAAAFKFLSALPRPLYFALLALAGGEPGKAS